MGSSVIFSGTKVKTLKSTIDLNGGNDIISSTTDPTSVAVSANIGSLLLNSSSGKLYRKNDSGSSTNWSEVGSGQSGINYISNPSAATNTTGWSTYAESDSVTFQDTGDTVTLNSHGLSNGTAVSFSVITTTTGISTNTLYYVVGATTNTFQLADTVGGAAKALTNNGSGTLLRSIPKLGTGGSANITWTRSTTTPLRGAADFEFNKDAANRMGQGVSTDFTIDNADLAKVLTISFDCEVVSGTYAAGDLDIFIIQDPSGTPVLIQPAGYVIQAGSVGTKVRQIATFQTDSSVKSYRLCIHASTVNASAYVVAADTVTVGPQVIQYGSPITDWQSYTPTWQGFGTPTSVEVQYRRVGDSIDIQGKFTLGTTTAVEAQIGLPAGLSSASTSKIPSITSVGIWMMSDAEAMSGSILSEPSKTYLTVGKQGSGTGGLSKLNGNSIGSSGRVISFFARVPIAGWSSTVQMSNDTDTRVVGAFYRASANCAGSTSQDINFDSRVYDTHAAVTPSAAGTGSWKFTAPVPGLYSVKGNLAFTTATQSEVQLFKNGTLYQKNIGWVIAANGQGSFVAEVELLAGDYIAIRTSASITVAGGALNTTIGTISVHRLSGPSAIAASETVAAKYSGSVSATASTTQPIQWNTKQFDTHSAVTTGTNWKFTAPVSGVYLVACTIANATQTTGVTIYKNGSSTPSLLFSANFTYWESGAVSISLLAGDYIDIRTGNSVTISADTTASVTIVKVGN